MVPEGHQLSQTHFLRSSYLNHFSKIFDQDKVIEIAESMMGNILVTRQTGDKGKKVNRIFIEEACQIEREFYLSMLVDRNSSKLMMMLSSAGGMDIEEIAITNPEKINNIYFDNFDNISLPGELEKKLDINESQF